MSRIKKESKRLTIQVERVVNPPKVTFGFAHLHEVSWKDGKDVTFFKDLLVHLTKFSRLTWQGLYQAPRHGLGTEKLPVSAVKQQMTGVPEGIDNLLVLRATGDNHPMLGFRNGDVFEVLFLEANFGDVYRH